MDLLLSRRSHHHSSFGDFAVWAERARRQGVELVITNDSTVRPSEMEIAGASFSDIEGMGAEKGLARVRWLMLPSNTSDAQFLYWERYAHVLRSGLVVQEPIHEIFAGVPVAITHGTCLTDAIEAVSWARSHGAYTCWEIEPGACKIEEFDRILTLTLPHLAHIRLLGTDPKVLRQPTDMSHVDVLMRMLESKQMHGDGTYSGTIALVPVANDQDDDVPASLLHASGWSCCTAA